MSNESVTSRKARRIYPYKGANLVCFAGTRYISSTDSNITSAHPLTAVTADGSECPKTITVTQRVAKKKGITETWKRFDG